MNDFHPNLLNVARAVDHGTEPEELLANTDFFLNLVMARASLEQARIAQHHFSKEQFRAAYKNAPADLYLPPSWEYWGFKLYGASDYIPPPPGYPRAPPEPPCEYPPELLTAARRVDWSTKPEELLRDTDLFLNEVMARGRPEAIQAALKHYTEDQFRSAYEFAPPGLYGPVTWAYWGLMLFGNAEHKPNPVTCPSRKP